MIDTLMPLIKQFMPFAQERMGFSTPPRLFLRGDDKNAKNPLGKTAYYDPGAKSITLYVTKRHPKDVMRSLSHELVHHTQNCGGQFKDVGEMGEGYAQNDEHLREMEREAYEMGNMCFRDWEDSIKSTIYFESLQKQGVKEKMSTKKWKNGELNSLLLEKWGFKFDLKNLNEGADKNTGTSGVDGDDDDNTFMGHIKEEEEEDLDEKMDSLGEVAGVGSGAPSARDRRKPRLQSKPWSGAKAGDESSTHSGEKDYTTKKDDELKDTGKGRGEKKGDKAYVNEDSGAEEGEHYKDNAMHDEDHIKAIEHHLDALKHDRDYDEDHEGLEESPAHPAADREGNRGTGRRVKKAGQRIEEVLEHLTGADSKYTHAEVREALKRAIVIVKETTTHGQEK